MEGTFDENVLGIDEGALDGNLLGIIEVYAMESCCGQLRELCWYK